MRLRSFFEKQLRILVNNEGKFRLWLQKFRIRMFLLDCFVRLIVSKLLDCIYLSIYVRRKCYFETRTSKKPQRYKIRRENNLDMIRIIHEIFLTLHVWNNFYEKLKIFCKFTSTCQYLKERLQLHIRVVQWSEQQHIRNRVPVRFVCYDHN